MPHKLNYRYMNGKEVYECEFCGVTYPVVFYRKEDVSNLPCPCFDMHRSFSKETVKMLPVCSCGYVFKNFTMDFNIHEGSWLEKHFAVRSSPQFIPCCCPQCGATIVALEMKEFGNNKLEIRETDI